MSTKMCFLPCITVVQCITLVDIVTLIFLGYLFHFVIGITFLYLLDSDWVFSLAYFLQILSPASGNLHIKLLLIFPNKCTGERAVDTESAHIKTRPMNRTFLGSYMRGHIMKIWWG